MIIILQNLQFVGQHATYHNDSFAQNMLILLQKQIFILLDTFIF